MRKTLSIFFYALNYIGGESTFLESETCTSTQDGAACQNGHGAPGTCLSCLFLEFMPPLFGKSTEQGGHKLTFRLFHYNLD